MARVFRDCVAFFLWYGVILIPFCVSADPGDGLKFIENKSQWPAEFQYRARIPGGALYVQPGTFTFVFHDQERLQQLHESSHHPVVNEAERDDVIEGIRVDTRFIGANHDARVLPIGQHSDYTNYFIGADECNWSSNVRSYQALMYRQLYPGIDMKVYSQGANLKYDFIVAPDGEAGKIRFRYSGAQRTSLNKAGDVEVLGAWPLFTEKKPIAFQLIDGRRVDVPCEYQFAAGEVSFHFPDGYDICNPLIIDPLLIFSTYSGSTADNWGSTATPGEHGSLYSAGVTWDNFGGRFPATSGAFQLNLAGGFDISILKYDSTGSKLLYATYLGGSQTDAPHSLVVNQANELLVLGTTSSFDFPTTAGAYQRRYAGGSIQSTNTFDYTAGSDILVSRISSDGSSLLASTFLGGSANDGLNRGILVQNYGDEQRGDIITDKSGTVYLASVTSSIDFPIVNGFDATYGMGNTDAIVVSMNNELSDIIWSTFIGGSGADACHTIQFDKAGDLYVAGGTASLDFPVTAGCYQAVNNNGADGWIASLSADGSTIKHATYTGTASFDEVFFVDLNEDDEVYVYGQTSGAFPVSQGVYSNPNSGQFIQKFNHELTQLQFSTVIGSGRGIPDISPTAFLVNDCNNIYIAGWGGVINSAYLFWQNTTFGLPVSADAYQPVTHGSDFYFMVLTADASEFLYGTYLGGNSSLTHVDGGTSRFDKNGIVYHAVCAGCAAGNAQNQATSDFPATKNAWSKLNRSLNCNNAAFKFDLSSLKARLQSNSVQLDHPGLDKICIPDPIVFQNFSTGGEIFEWNLGDGTQLTKYDTSMVIHQYQQTGLYTVWLKAIDRGTCKVKDSASVKVNVNIADIRVQDDDDVCLNAPYTLQASGGQSYFWFTSDHTFESTEQTPSVSPSDTTRYIVRVTERSGCIQQDTVQLNVIPTIDPVFEWSQSAECFERPDLRVVSTTDSLWETDRLFFDFGDGTISESPEETHRFEKDGVFNVKLVLVRDACVTEKTVPVPTFQLKIPNVITPGKKDALNDAFTIQYGPVSDVTPAHYGFSVRLTIYNRWGNRVYHSDDYQYDWDGDGVEGGVYYYEVTVQDHATCKSWLHLVK